MQSSGETVAGLVPEPKILMMLVFLLRIGAGANDVDDVGFPVEGSLSPP
jgi:hypothetical protein